MSLYLYLCSFVLCNSYICLSFLYLLLCILTSYSLSLSLCVCVSLFILFLSSSIFLATIVMFSYLTHTHSITISFTISFTHTHTYSHTLTNIIWVYSIRKHLITFWQWQGNESWAPPSAKPLQIEGCKKLMQKLSHKISRHFEFQLFLLFRYQRHQLDSNHQPWDDEKSVLPLRYNCLSSFNFNIIASILKIKPN